MKFRITGFVDLVHVPEFEIQENTTVQKKDLFLSSGNVCERERERDTSTLSSPLEKANLTHWT
jgi:hypothetical protein